MQNIAGEEVRDVHGSGAPGDAGGDQEDVLPRVRDSLHNEKLYPSVFFADQDSEFFMLVRSGPGETFPDPIFRQIWL